MNVAFLELHDPGSEWTGVATMLLLTVRALRAKPAESNVVGNYPFDLNRGSTGFSISRRGSTIAAPSEVRNQTVPSEACTAGDCH